MRPPGDLHLLAARHDDRDDLEREPSAERPCRRDADRDAHEQQHPDPRLGIEQQIGGEHARDRSGGADERCGRGGRHHRVQQRRGDPAQDVEDQEPGIAESILDIVSEHPEERHVGDEMQPPAMQELVGDERQRFGDRAARRRAEMDELVRDDAEARRHRPQRLVAGEGAGHQEDHHIGEDDRPGHELEADDLVRRVVMDGHEHQRFSPLTQSTSPSP